MADSELVPNHGGKNWVTKTGGLPEYISRIAKDLMEKGMPESEAIATAVNTVKRWSRGGGKVTEKTRAKAAAALAEWEAKKAASHVGLSVPTRLDSTRRGSLLTMDLAAVLDRANQIADPVDRQRVVDLATKAASITVTVPKILQGKVNPDGTYAGMNKTGLSLSPAEQKAYDRMRARLAAKRDRAQARQDRATSRAGQAQIRRSVAADRKKARLAVAAKRKAASAAKKAARKPKGAKGPKSKYVKPPARVKPLDAAGLAKQQAASGGGGQAKWAHGWVPLNDAAKAQVKANPQKFAQMRKQQAGGGKKSGGRVVALSTLVERAGRIQDPLARRAARQAIIDLAATNTVSFNTDKVREAFSAQESKRRQALMAKREQARQRGEDPSVADYPEYRSVKEVWNTHLITSGENGKLHKIPYEVGANGVDVKFGAPTPVTQQYVELSAANEPGLLAVVEDDGRVIDLAKPGQRYRHGWIRIEGVPVGKSVPKVAGRRGLVDGLSKEGHRARVDELVKIPRQERTSAQHLAFVRSNAVLRGERPPTKTVLPAGQAPGSTGGMTTPRKIAAPNGGNEVQIKQFEDALHAKADLNSTHAKELATRLDRLHTERGQKMWPGLSPEQARYRSVQDWQLRNGQVSVGKNWQKPDWYTGPDPKVVKQGEGNAPGAPSPNAPSGHVNPPVTASGPISRRQATAELNTKDRKAADRLISEMPKMEAAHLQVAIDSPSTSQKVKDAAKAELAKRSTPDKPWSEIPNDYKTTINGVRHIMSGEGGTHMRPYRDPKAPSAGQLKRADELSKGSTGRSPRADEPATTPPPPFDRGTFKSHGIKHGDHIEAVKYDHEAKGPRVIRGMAHVKGSTIGVQEGDTLHTLGGVATKVMARKVPPPGWEKAGSDGLSRLAEQVKQERGIKSEMPMADLHAMSDDQLRSLATDRSALFINQDRAKNILETRRKTGNLGQVATGSAHPEKFKPGEKPAVHKFMNTERLQAIAADTSLDPEKQANAAKAKEILAKRLGSKNPAKPNAYDLGLTMRPDTSVRGGLSSKNDASRAMTERILASREAAKAAPKPNVTPGLPSRISKPGKTKSGLPAMAIPTTPTEKYAALSTIVNNKQAHEIQGVVVDMNSANMVKTVIDGLSPEHRTQLLALPFHQMVDRALKILERARTRGPGSGPGSGARR